MNKGLCNTCIHDKDCSFPRKLPVLQCEEFSDIEIKPVCRKERKPKRK